MEWWFWLIMILPALIVVGVIVAFVKGIKGELVEQLKPDHQTTGASAGGDGLIALAWLSGVLLRQVTNRKNTAQNRHSEQ